jgi:hypothetical protein
MPGHSHSTSAEAGSRCHQLRVQIIEVSVSGVRSAALQLRRPETSLRFRMYPMIHVGLPSFYADVATRLRDCDLIVAEGIEGLSEETAAITTMYEQSTRGRGSSMVVQNIDYDGLGPPVIYPDMTGADLDRSIREHISLSDRLLLRAASPVVGLLSRFVGPEILMNPFLTVDDLPTAQQQAMDDRFEGDRKVFVDDRDALVNEALSGIYEQHSMDAMAVGVVYGAAHVPGIFRFLSRTYRYRVVRAEWMKPVFTFQPAVIGNSTSDHADASG